MVTDAIVKVPPTIRLLSSLSLPSYAATPARPVLVVVGIALGISLLAAIGLVNASVLANFRAMIERTAGKADLQVELGTGEIGFAETVIDLVKNEPAVHHAFGMVRGTLHAVDGSGEVLHAFGIDLVSDAIDSYDVRAIGDTDALELLNDSNAILLAEDYARRRGLVVGSSVRMATPTGVSEFHVRGLLKAEGLATVFGGNLAVMDILTAQARLGKEGRLDQIDVILRPDTLVSEIRQRLASALPPSLTVSRPASRGERIERAIASFQAMLDGLSLLCLLASIFIVYNTTATAIAERARDIAVLRTVGIEPWRTFALVISETAILGAVGSIIGVVVGIGLARALTTLVAESMGAIYQVRFPLDSLRLSGWQVAWNLAIGIASAIAAAIVPARRAMSLDPIALMRDDYRERLTGRASTAGMLGIGALVATAALVAVIIEQQQRSIAWGNAGAMLWWLAGLVLSIPAMTAIARFCRRPLIRWFGAVGQVAAAGLQRSPGRTGVTVGVIGLSLTVAIALASAARSFRESQRNLITLAGDLVVSAVGTEGGWLESPLSSDVQGILREIAGVSRVETYRALQGQMFRNARIAIVAVSPGFVGTPQFRSMIVAGDADEAERAIREDSGVVISDNLAEPFGLRAGEMIAVDTPSGPTSMRVGAVVANDYSGDRGSIVMNRDRFAALWNGDDQVSHFNVFLTPSANLEAVRAEIARSLGGRYFVKVLTLPQLVAYHQGMIDRAFAFTYAIQLLVIVVSLAGIVDLLTSEIIERRHEIGLLQVVGADQQVIARAIWIEALVIGLSGALLGAAVSIGTSILWVRVNFRILIGYIVEHHYAGVTAAWCVVLAGGVALIAGRMAARRALRQPLLEMIRYE